MAAAPAKQRTRRRHVTVPATEPKRGKLWSYGVRTLAKLTGKSVDGVRQAIHRGAFNPDDLRSVMAWVDKQTPPKLPGKGWPPRMPRLADGVIAALINASARLVRTARQRGHFDPDDALSVAAWIYERRRWGKPVPSRQFERHMLIALPRARARGVSERAKSRRVHSLQALRGELEALGFTAEVRGAHIYVKPDLLPAVGARRLIDTMNAAGLSADDVPLRKRRAYALGASVALPQRGGSRVIRSS